MTFGDLYRDIFSRLSLNTEDHDVFFQDIAKSINDAIREIRIKYIQRGLGHEFATTETVSSFTTDSDYPFVQSATLSNKIMQDIPIEFTVLSSTCYNTANEITNTTQTFNAGDKAYKDDSLYVCVESFSSVNTYTLTFDPQDVRNYYRANGLTYEVGDVVLDKESGSYYKVNTAFTNNYDTDADSVTELDKLYWKKIGSAHVYAAHYPFKFIHALRIFENIDYNEVISVLDDKVYATPGVAQITLTYIPKWTDVSDMTVSLDLPDFMIPEVKDRALIRIGQKIGVEMQMIQRDQEDGG